MTRGIHDRSRIHRRRHPHPDCGGGLGPEHRLGGICRLRSGRSLRSCARRPLAFAGSPVVSGGQPRRSRGWCAATRQCGAAAWSIGPLRLSGTPSERHGVRSRQSWRATQRCGHMCRIGSLARSAPGRAAVPGPAIAWKGRRHGRRQDRRSAKAWSPEQFARRLRLDFPEDATMRISHEAIYQSLYV
jgi:hypothetical protein